MFDLKDILSSSLYVFGDLVAVCGPEQERAENQHIQRALEKGKPAE
jgi:hypothetical protein